MRLLQAGIIKIIFATPLLATSDRRRLKNVYKILNNKFSPKGQILIAQPKARVFCGLQGWVMIAE